MIKLVCALSILAIANIHGLNIQPRMLNGILSNPGEFPFFVYISNDVTTCSAILLSDRWVLTAGHCLSYNLTLNVHFGIDANGEFIDEMEIPIANQHIHPKYIDHNFPSQDLGLIELPRATVSSPNIRPIQALTECGDDLENIEVVAIGNGKTSIFGERQDTLLREIHQTSMTTEECEFNLRRHNRSFTVICTRVIERHSLSRGDSGGPLLRRSNGSLIGVASFIDGKSGVFPPQLTLNAFTRVHLFYEWIAELTGLDMPNCSV